MPLDPGLRLRLTHFFDFPTIGKYAKASSASSGGGGGGSTFRQNSDKLNKSNSFCYLSSSLLITLPPPKTRMC